MKKILAVSLVLIFSQIFFAQAKVDEYKSTDSDRESSHIDSFLTTLIDMPESKGLIVIYTGVNKDKLGNILGHIKGIKTYLLLKKFDLEKISFVIAEGRTKFLKELWIAKKDEEFPEFDKINLDLSNLTGKYLYAQTSFNYEPSIKALDTGKVDSSQLGEILKQNKKLKGIIFIDKRYLRYAINFRNELIQSSGIGLSQVSIKISSNEKANFTLFLK